MADKISTAVTYTASGSAVAFGLNANEVGAIVGASVAILTLLVNIWFKHQHLKLAKQKASAVDDASGD